MTIRKSMFHLVNAYASKVEGNELGASVTFTDEKLATMLAEVEQGVARKCAELCDAITYEGYVPPEDGAARDYYDSAAQDCADAIRAKFLTGEEGK